MNFVSNALANLGSGARWIIEHPSRVVWYPIDIVLEDAPRDMDVMGAVRELEAAAATCPGLEVRYPHVVLVTRRKQDCYVRRG